MSQVSKAAQKALDAIVVGGGHNGLTTAAYMARAGLKVAVCERRHLVGGAAVTEELYPGFKMSRASYLWSLFRPQIVQELGLKAHGLRILPRNPSSFTPLLDGRSLLIGADAASNYRQVAQFSERDAEALPRYEHMLERLTRIIDPLLDTPPFEPGAGSKLSDRLDDARAMWHLLKTARKMLHRGDVQLLHEMMTAPASRILDRWFESEPLKSGLATDAVIGAMVSPNTPGSAYVLFHHVMGESEGQRGVWSYVQGGMGAVSEALASSARSFGASIRTSTPVKQILVENDQVVGVELENGEQLRARVVLSNATPTVTFLRLMQKHHIPDEFRKRIEGIDSTSPVTKINLALDRLPNFKCLPSPPNGEPAPHHRTTIHFTESCAELETAYRDAKCAGIPSRRPLIEMTIPSSIDKTISPEGKHVASLFVQYTPYAPYGKPWTPQLKREFTDTCFNLIEEYAPGFRDSVMWHETLTPPDLERTFGLTGGNIFHASMGLDQLFWLRPTAGAGRYRTPIRGLYMCGAGTHPGGGVMGAPGRNAAHVVLNDIKHKRV